MAAEEWTTPVFKNGGVVIFEELNPRFHRPRLTVKGGIRLYELASVMGVDSKKLVKTLRSNGVPNPRLNGSVKWGSSSRVPYKVAIWLLNN